MMAGHIGARTRWRKGKADSSRNSSVNLPLAVRQQGVGDRLPLGGQRPGRDRLAGAAIPAAGVAEIALLAVEIGMDPGTDRVVLGLSAFMRLLPVALAVPPQRPHRHAEIRRRLGRGERML